MDQSSERLMPIRSLDIPEIVDTFSSILRIR